MKLGTRISTWRKLRKLTQQDLAEACEITAGAVSLWESNDTAPSQKHLSKVVRRLGLTMDRFYGQIADDEAKAS